MPVIQRADIVDKIRRRMGVRGGRNPFDLDYSIVPVVLVEDLSRDREDQFTDRPACGYQVQAAVAAQNSKIGIFNPVDSGAEIEVVAFFGFINGTTLGDVVMGFRSSALGGGSVATKRFLNTRFADPAPVAGNPIPVAVISVQAGAGVTANPIAKIQVGSGGAFTAPVFPVGAILAPGHGLEWDTIAVNVTFEGTIWWIERSLSSVQTP